MKDKKFKLHFWLGPDAEHYDHVYRSNNSWVPLLSSNHFLKGLSLSIDKIRRFGSKMSDYRYQSPHTPQIWVQIEVDGKRCPHHADSMFMIPGPYGINVHQQRIDHLEFSDWYHTVVHDSLLLWINGRTNV